MSTSIILLLAGCLYIPGADQSARLADLDGDGIQPPEDCDDTNPDTFPGAEDIAGDSRDADCDGADGTDADNDGYPLGIDCNDSDNTIFPAAEDPFGDTVDTNCDGRDGTDADGDGVSAGPDCNDANPAIYPGVTEICGNNVDDSCAGIYGSPCRDELTAGISGFPAINENATDALLGISLVPDLTGTYALIAGSPHVSGPSGVVYGLKIQDTTFNATVIAESSNSDGLGMDLATATDGRTVWLAAVAPYRQHTLSFYSLPTDGTAIAKRADLSFDGHIAALQTDTLSWATQVDPSAVAVFAGTDGDAVVTENPGTSEDFGLSLVTADLDGDGHDELLASSPTFIDGAVWLVTNGVATLLASSNAPYYGRGLDACDVNADGVTDVLVGSPNSNGGIGAVEIYLGPIGPTVETPDLVLTGPASGTNFGVSVVCQGDIDGYYGNDIAVAAPDTAAGGNVYVFPMDESAFTHTLLRAADAPLVLSGPGQQGAGFGIEMVFLPDVDGDGDDELAIGAPYFDNDGGILSYADAGYVALYLGAPVQ